MARKGSRFLRIVRVRYRRAMARIDRNTPEWMQWITPYGTSITLHGVALLLLGIFVLANNTGAEQKPLDADFPQQLLEDMNALQESDHAGDPLSTIKSPEPPSITLDPSQTDETVFNVPELPADFKMSSELNLKAPTESVAMTKSADGSGRGVSMTSGEKLSAPFSGRGTKIRAKMNISQGGSVHSERAVQTGLDWIFRHQREDGSWNLDPSPQCKGASCPKSPNKYPSDAAATGLALMPMLGAGNIHTEPSKYQNCVKKGLAWLVAHQKEDGDLFSGGSGQTQMYSHAIATMALCEAYGLSQDEKLKAPAQKAIDFIAAARCKTPPGGWRYNPGAAGDTSVFGWQMFALRSGALSGLKISNETWQGCRDYLDKAAADPYKATYSYEPGGAYSAVMTAEALLSRQYLGWHRNNEALIQGATLVAEDLQKSEARNIYYWYYATQMLHNMQGQVWQEWNVRVRDGLVAIQVGSGSGYKGCDRGSWDPTRPVVDQWGAEAGRHFLTCMSLLTLEVYYRYLPLYSETDRNVEDARKAPSPKGRGKDPKAVAAREKAEKADKDRMDKEKADKGK